MSDAADPRNFLSAMQDWPEMTIPVMVQRMGDRAGTRPVLVFRDRSISFGELADLMERVACYFISAGVRPGDRLLFLTPPSDGWAALHYGCMAAGAIAVPLNLALTSEELRPIWDETRPAGVVCSAQFRGDEIAARVEALPAWTDNTDKQAAPQCRLLLRDGEPGTMRNGWRNATEAMAHAPSQAERQELARRLQDIAPQSSCAIVFTSGSTGRPKPALLHHRGILGASWWYGEAIRLDAKDRILSPSPSFHVSGISAGLTLGHIRGLPTWLMEYYDPGTAIDLIEREKLTVFTGFDTIFTTMLAHPRFAPHRVATIRKLQMATGPAMHDRVQAVFPNLAVTSRCFAMTETCGPSSLTAPDETAEPARKYSNGRVLPGVEVVITALDSDAIMPTAERGEIRVRGWNLFNGYFDNPAATRDSLDPAGYFKTGDLGRFDMNGLLYLEGRLKRMIKTGGENVSEREVEIFLEDKVPGVNLAQIVGLPDPHWGEIVVAFVEPMPGTQLDEAGLRAACRGRIANFKIPKRVFFVAQDEWPRTSAGKISKAGLAAIAEADRRATP